MDARRLAGPSLYLSRKYILTSYALVVYTGNMKKLHSTV